MQLLSPEHARLESRKLYTVLLDALHTQAPEFLPWAAEAYFWHAWKQQFPDAPARGTPPVFGPASGTACRPWLGC